MDWTSILLVAGLLEGAWATRRNLIYFRATPLSCQALENPIILLRRIRLSLELKRRRLGMTASPCFPRITAEMVSFLRSSRLCVLRRSRLREFETILLL